MKKFAVLRKIGIFNATVVREFNEKGPQLALDFARALALSEDNEQIEYAVAEVYSIDEWQQRVDDHYSCPGA